MAGTNPEAKRLAQRLVAQVIKIKYIPRSVEQNPCTM